MSELQETRPTAGAASITDAAQIDAGLRRYFLAIYRKVALGLGVAGSLAYATASIPAVRDLLFRPAPEGSLHAAQLTFWGCLVAFAPIAVLLASARSLAQPTPRTAGRVYWTVVSLLGASMGVVALSFTGFSIATTFAVAAAAFGGLSLFGYATRKDLTAFGAFVTAGLVGLLATLVLNVFLRSPAIDFVVNAVGVMVFAGLIAHDTQRLKLAYHQLAGDAGGREAASSLGALSLVISFLNLFQFLLLLASGERR